MVLKKLLVVSMLCATALYAGDTTGGSAGGGSNAASDITILDAAGLYDSTDVEDALAEVHPKQQEVTIPSNGTGAVATYSLTPTASFVRVSCNDSDGCEIILTGTDGTSGQQLSITNSNESPVTFSGDIVGNVGSLASFEVASFVNSSSSWIFVPGNGIGGNVGTTDNALLCSAGTGGKTAQACEDASVFLGPSLSLNSSGIVAWDAGEPAFVNAADFWLFRPLANTLALRDGGNAAPAKFVVYNTGTDNTDYERAAITGVAGASINITAETAGTGGDNLNVVLTPAGEGTVNLNGPTLIGGNGVALDKLAIAANGVMSRYTGTLDVGGSWSVTGTTIGFGVSSGGFRLVYDDTSGTYGTYTTHLSSLNNGHSLFLGGRVDIATYDLSPATIGVVGLPAAADAVTNLDGGNVLIIGGKGSADSAGDADGGNVLIDGGQGFGTGDKGTVVVNSKLTIRTDGAVIYTPVASPPVACSGHAGWTYVDSTDGAFCSCNGTVWTPTPLTGTCS